MLTFSQDLFESLYYHASHMSLSYGTVH